MLQNGIQISDACLERVVRRALRPSAGTLVVDDMPVAVAKITPDASPVRVVSIGAVQIDDGTPITAVSLTYNDVSSTGSMPVQVPSLVIVALLPLQT